MSINTSRLVTLPLALLAAVALPLGLMAPAQAATTRDGCTVNPLLPEFRGTFSPANLPYVYYPFEVSCIASAGGLTAEVRTEAWESDRAGWVGDVDFDGVNNADDELIGAAARNVNFGAAGGSTTVEIRRELLHTDTDFNEENYQSVKFRVRSGPVTGGWTTPELTQTTQVGW